MASAGETDVPQSPETQPPDVREQLAQEQVSHDGSVRSGADVRPGTSGHLGAVDTEVTPIMPPVRGPADLVGDEESDNSIDPADEITPG